MKTTKYASLLLYFLLGALLLFSFYSLISLDPILEYDDTLILGGLQGAVTFSNYIERFLAGHVLDIQPIRDISYLIDIQIKSIIPSYSFHLTNLLIWMAICFLFKKILELFDDNKNSWLIWSLVFIYALSPVSSSSVAWIAARKHLLSTFFTMFATFIFLKKRKDVIDTKSTLAIIVLYLAGTLSQPINVLWPGFVFLYSYFDKKLKERKVLLIVLALIAVSILAANFYYYETLYSQITGGDGKYDSNANLGLSLLAVGRYFYLTLFPFDALPVSHYQGSWQNLAGLFLLVPFIYIIYKKTNEKIALFCFFIYFIIPLMPVTYKITRIFCSDTYILNASIGIYVVSYFLLKDLKFKKSYIVLFLYAGFLFCYNLSYIKSFQTTESIWFYSYNKEPSVMSIANSASNLIARKQYDLANELVKEFEEMSPGDRFIGKLKSDLIYLNDNYTEGNKIERLESFSLKTPVDYLRLALMYSNQGKSELVKKNITSLFADPKAYITHSYLKNEELLALVRVSCEKNKMEDECKDIYLNFTKSVKFVDWKPAVYEERYFELKKHSENLSYR